MDKAVFLELGHRKGWSDLFHPDGLSVAYRTWEEMTDEDIVDYNIVAIYLEHSQVDLIYFLREKLSYRPVVIIVFLPDEDADSFSDYLAAGADIVRALPDEDEDVRPVINEARKHLEVGDLRLDSVANALKDAVDEVFTTLVQMPVTLTDLQRTELHINGDDHAAVMNVKGELNGFILMELPSAFGATLISRILPVDINDLDRNDVTEALFEFVNMIAGNTKSRLNTFCHAYTLTQPKELDEKNKHEYIGKKCTALHFENDQKSRFTIFYHFA